MHEVFARRGGLLVPPQIACLLAVLALSACRLFTPAPSPAVQASQPASPATTVPVPAVTLASVSPSLEPPTAPPLPPGTRAAPPAQTHPASLQLKMFLVAIGDNGQSGKAVGCGDSLVPVDIDVPYTRGVLRAALEQLLAVKAQYYGQSGLYNALYMSDLRIDAVELNQGEAVIRLSGQVQLGGECDTPRLIGQIEETALQFSTVRQVTIFLNGKLIREALSLRGF
jgi:hypothetical protein